MSESTPEQCPHCIESDSVVILERPADEGDAAAGFRYCPGCEWFGKPAEFGMWRRKPKTMADFTTPGGVEARNAFEIRGEHAAIFIINKKRQRVEVLIDTVDLDRVAERVWHCNGRGYVKSADRGTSIHLSRFIIDAPSALVVDHINGDPLDNRRANLRAVTQMINAQNRSSRRRDGSPSCVSEQGNGRWRARITVAGKEYVEYHRTQRQAAKAVARMRRLYMPGWTGRK